MSTWTMHILTKRLQDVISCTNPKIRKERLQNLHDDMNWFNWSDCPFAVLFRNAVVEEMEGLA